MARPEGQGGDSEAGGGDRATKEAWQKRLEAAKAFKREYVDHIEDRFSKPQREAANALIEGLEEIIENED